MDYKLNQICFVVTLLRLSLLRRLCKAYDLLKKESRVCKEYDIHSVSWNHCVNDGKKEETGREIPRTAFLILNTTTS